MPTLMYTPGPYIVTTHHGRLAVATADGSMVLADCRLANDPEFAANARLFAAAPDMAEELRAAWCVLANMATRGAAETAAMDRIGAVLARLDGEGA